MLAGSKHNIVGVDLMDEFARKGGSIAFNGIHVPTHKCVRMRKIPGRYAGGIIELQHLLMVVKGFEIASSLDIVAVEPQQALRCLKGKVFGGDELLQGDASDKQIIIAIGYDTTSNGSVYFLFDANEYTDSTHCLLPSPPLLRVFETNVCELSGYYRGGQRKKTSLQNSSR